MPAYGAAERGDRGNGPCKKPRELLWKVDIPHAAGVSRGFLQGPRPGAVRLKAGTSFPGRSLLEGMLAVAVVPQVRLNQRCSAFAREPSGTPARSLPVVRWASSTSTKMFFRSLRTASGMSSNL